MLWLSSTALIVATCLLLALATTSADAPSVRLVSRQTICPTTPESPTNIIGSLIRLKSGRLLAVWCSGPGPETDNQRWLWIGYSDDNGHTWPQPFITVDTPDKCDINPSLMQADSGQVVLFYHSYTGEEKHTTLVRRSDDEGMTWSAAETGHPHCFVQGCTAMRLGPGHFIWPANLEQQSGVIISEDDAQSWRWCQQRTTLDHRGGTSEPSIVQLADGSLLAALRTHKGCHYFSHSTDQGENWGEPVPAPELPAPQAPARMVRTSEGRILLAYSHATPELIEQFGVGSHKPRNKLFLVESRDEGATWSEPVVIDSQDDTDIQIGYPSLVQTGDELLVLYHFEPGYVTVGTKGPGEMRLARFELF